MSEPIMQQILTTLKEMQEEQRTMKNTMNSFQEEQKSMRNTMDSFQEEQVSMKDTMHAMQQEISTIKETMATKDDIADIPAIKVALLETLETVKRIEAKQENHELTLDLLSRRSIDQEADIKRLKQA